jgi:glycosyltransferase involved in cell wall biosynthesis
MRVVFLYTELAAYTIACLKKASEAGFTCHVLRYPVNKEAPFLFKGNSSITFYNRSDFSELELKKTIAELKPEIIFCSGWNDKIYLRTCKHFRKLGVKTVLCMDNHWGYSLRKLAASILSPIMIKPSFTYAWVPGDIQRSFALKLGFRIDEIFDGFYSADSDFFSEIFRLQKPTKERKFPKCFLYVGRYYEFKGLKTLWDAFIELQTEHPNEWELHCVGTGELPPVKHPKIKHYGFMQPEMIGDLIENAGVFVFPSLFEPWGVAVHEMSLAGMPLVLSDKVGAASKFLSVENGFQFRAGSKLKLKECLKMVVECGDEKLVEMSSYSHLKGLQITTDTWVNTIHLIKKQ